MGKKGVLKWNASQLKSVKRDLLFFADLYYDPDLLNLHIKHLENVSKLLKNPFHIIDEISANVEFLNNKKVLHKFELKEYTKGNVKLKKLNENDISEIQKIVSKYDFAHRSFMDKYDKTVRLLKSDYNTGYLKFINLLTDFDNFADHHVRLSGIILEKSNPGFSVTPIIENLSDIPEGKKTQIIRLTVNNLPIPDDSVSLDEILDFRNETDNKRIYLGLINWINRISHSNLDIYEIKEQLEYYTLDFENRMKLEKQKYKLTTVEVVLTLPLELIENLVKFNWSKIPKTLITIKKNKLNLMIGETKAPGREMAYIVKANETFEKKQNS